MRISAILNDSEEPLRANTNRSRQPTSHTNPLPVRRRPHPSCQSMTAYSAPSLTPPRTSSSSSSTQSSERADSNPRRANRPKYSKEEEAFIWFHRVDLAQEWDMVVRAFNDRFPHSRPRLKSGLECKLYRVLSHNGIPQIREWRKRGDRMVEEVTGYYNFGIIEATTIRYPWMGLRYWDPRAWQ